MANDRIASYAEAFYEIAKAEQGADEVEDELFRFARIFEANEELRSTLVDASIPPARRQQIIEELLGDRVSPVTTSLVSMLVAVGRVRELPAIARAVVELNAKEHRRAVAEVRSAVPLTAEQISRLTTALGAALGKEVSIKVIVDPSVLGGILTQIGDTVIDGTVRTKLARLREAMSETR
jgi:F-type H+-transporting ATPase subunit delta